MIKNKDMVLWIGLQRIKNIKDNGKMICNMDWEVIIGLMEKFNTK